MNVKTLLTGIIAFAAMTQAASAFPATDDYQSNVGGSPPYLWSAARNWQRFDGSNWVTATVAPSSSHFVTIRVSNPITVNSSEASAKLQVDSSATLSIVSGGTLSINYFDVTGTITVIAGASPAKLTVSGTGSATSNIQSGGKIELGDASNAGTLEFTSVNQTVVSPSSGSGYIQGKNASALIQMASGIQLTNELLIQGMMTVQAASSTCTFANYRSSGGDLGVVLANANGIFKFASSVKFADNAPDNTHRPLYKIDGASYGSATILEFDREADGSPDARLKGRFEMVSCGKLKALASVETEGFLVASPAGFIDVDTNANVCFVFDAVSGSPTSYCNNTTLGSCP